MHSPRVPRLARSATRIAAAFGTSIAALGALGPARAAGQPAPADTAQPRPPSAEGRFAVFPGGHLFAPLVASPKEPQFRNSYLWARSTRDLNTQIAVTEPGGTVSLLRRRGRQPGDGIELSIQASVAAQFDMRSDRWDLLNADYTFSYPISYRRGATAARLRFYHLSSHVGDEYLLFRERRPEFTASYRTEAVELLISRDIGRWRVYGGGEHAYSAAPAALKRNALQAGVEYVDPLGRWRDVARANAVFAAHVASAEERGWSPAASVRTGFEVRRGRAAARDGARYRALIEWSAGPAPYGQFFRFDRVHSLGVGCYVVP